MPLFYYFVCVDLALVVSSLMR